MVGFVTDREQVNLSRLMKLHDKGWVNMTEAERAEWTGDPLTAADFGFTSAVNLLPNGPYYASGVELTYRNSFITATATAEGSYLYAVAIVGASGNFEGKTMTLSLDSAVTSGNATAMATMYWHDGTGFEWAGASLTGAGTVTFQLTENTNSREYLAIYLYVSTETAVAPGDAVRYNGLMLEFGGVRHAYVPYFAILPTPATKGAYNYADLNRVELAVAELSNHLGLRLETKTDWNYWDIPTQRDMERYVQNIAILRDACPNRDSMPEAPVRMEGLNLNTANVIETILLMADGCYEAMPMVGEFYCGEV